MIILFILGILALTAVWNLYYRKRWDKNLSVQMKFLPDFVYEGEQGKIEEKIENRKRMPLPVLEVDFHLRKELVFHDMENTHISDYTYRRDVFALLGNQRITRQLTLDCTKRGHYRVDKVSFKAFSLLYGYTYLREQAVNADFYVYAARTDVREIVLTCEKMMGAAQCAKKIYEDPFAFNSIREYTITDPMKTINWKASAKTGGLMVNTFESTLTECAMIFLDVEDSGIIKQENLVEESISVAASLAQRFIARGMEVGLCVNFGMDGKEGSIRFAPEGGKCQLTKIEQLLAEHSAQSRTVRFETILKEPVKDAVTILISKNAAFNGDAIEKFVDSEMFAVWVVPVNRREECKIKAKRNLGIYVREVAEN